MLLFYKVEIMFEFNVPNKLCWLSFKVSFGFYEIYINKVVCNTECILQLSKQGDYHSYLIVSKYDVALNIWVLKPLLSIYHWVSKT